MSFAGTTIILFMIFAPYFATGDNFTRMFGQVAINTVLAVGMTFVILVGGIDLSVGSVLALMAFLLAITCHGGASSSQAQTPGGPIVGIAMGEVVVADNTVTGEGVVMAQRLPVSASMMGAR